MHEIKPLTSLRGCAALYVVLLHFSSTAQSHAAVNIPSLAPRGHLAVDLFFVLSGFIMAYTYLASFDARGLGAYGDFLGRRIARICPLNIAVLLILTTWTVIATALTGTTPFADMRSDNLAGDLVLNILMLQGIGIGRNLNGPSWSISTEFVAYLVFPLLIAAIFHRRVWVVGAALTLALAGLLTIALRRPFLGLDSDILGHGASVIRCIAEFTFGLAAYRLYNARRASEILGRSAVVVALSALTAAIMVLRLGDLLAVLLFPLLIVGFARNQGWPARVMASAVPYFLGVISYSLYLIHAAFRPLELDLLVALHPEPLGPVGALSFAAAGSLSVILPAWLAYRTIERPGRDIVRRLLAMRVRRAAAS
jgi:peptidoglycan/LPS O-acetylase OafA/YrhL